MIIDPETGEECPRAVFDEHGRLLNAEEAIGEMVSQTGGAGFEGYWRNAEAERGPGPQRLVLDRRPRLPRRGRLLLLRAAATTTGCGSTARTSPPPRSKRILQRHPDVVLASVYAVPDTVVGDQVMATLLLHDGPGLRPRGIRRVPGRRGGPRHQVGTQVRPGHRRAPGDGHHQGAEAGAAHRGVALRGAGVVAARAGMPPTVCCFPSDAEDLDRLVAEA